MRDVRIAELAGRQFNRVSRAQLAKLGYGKLAVERRVAAGRLVIVEEGVLAMPPVLDDNWGLWMGATLTAPHTFLRGASAAAAYGFWDRRRHYETVVRPGNGGPRRHEGVLAFRSRTLEGDTTELRGIPITTVARTLLDLAAFVTAKQLARCLREAIRLTDCTVEDIVECLSRHRGERGVRRLALALARYAGLPIEDARSGAEVRALEYYRDIGEEIPALNKKRAGEEADLSWPDRKLILEIDGGPFHEDKGEDARKERVWGSAGWTVRRIDSEDVYEHPEMLLALAAPPNVPEGPENRGR